jgi:hypothetical protein
MWVRAVRVAIVWVVGCCATLAQAAQYKEVWNPPEAQHAPKHNRATKPVSKTTVKTAVKTTSRGKGKQPLAAAKKGAAQNQAKAKPGVGVKVAQKSVGKRGAKMASTSARTTHLKTAANSSTRGQIKTAGAKSADALTAAHARSQTLAATPATAHPVSTTGSTSMRAATQRAPLATNRAARQVAPALASARPIDESSSLPPILH